MVAAWTTAFAILWRLRSRLNSPNREGSCEAPGFPRARSRLRRLRLWARVSPGHGPARVRNAGYPIRRASRGLGVTSRMRPGNIPRPQALDQSWTKTSETNGSGGNCGTICCGPTTNMILDIVVTRPFSRLLISGLGVRVPRNPLNIGPESPKTTIYSSRTSQFSLSGRIWGVIRG